MKTIQLSCMLSLSLLALGGKADLLFSDNFNTADTGNFDAASLAGRLSGSLASETYLRSFGFQQNINNNQLLLPSGTGGAHGVRFELATNDPTGGASDRYDWAGGSAGAQILSHGGLVVNFDWIPPNNTDNTWVSFQLGTVNADSGNLVNDDYGILFRHNGDTQRFDNSANLGSGNAFTASAGGVVRQVEITYTFNSFADGATVNAVSTVDGALVANDSFTWDSNGGALRMELGHNAPNTRIDNLTISTLVPEPASIALLGLGLLGLLRFRAR